MLPHPHHTLSVRLRHTRDRLAPTPEAAGLALRRAQTLAGAAFGEQPAAEGRAGVASGYVALAAAHAPCLPKPALMARLPWAVAAVTRRVAGETRIVLDGLPPTVKTLARALSAGLGAGCPGGVEIALAATHPVGADESALSAAAAALLTGLDAASPTEAGAAAVSEVLGRPAGLAHLLAAQVEAPLALVGAGAPGESVEVSEGLAFGVIEVEVPAPDRGGPPPPDVERAAERLRAYAGALAPTLADFEAAHGRLPEVERAAVRFLLEEARRAQRMVAALRRGDKQVFGALLLMSHAASVAIRRTAHPQVEAVMRTGGGAEGIYGAKAVGGRVVVAGRPFLLPEFLDRAAAVAAEFGRRPNVALL